MALQFQKFDCDTAQDQLLENVPFPVAHVRLLTASAGDQLSIAAMRTGRLAIYPVSGTFHLIAQDGREIHDVACVPGCGVVTQPKTWLHLCRFEKSNGPVRAWLASSVAMNNGDVMDQLEFERLIGRSLAKPVAEQ